MLRPWCRPFQCPQSKTDVKTGRAERAVVAGETPSSERPPAGGAMMAAWLLLIQESFVARGLVPASRRTAATGSYLHLDARFSRRPPHAVCMCALDGLAAPSLAPVEAATDGTADDFLRAVEESLAQRSLVRLSVSGNAVRAKAGAPTHLRQLKRIQGRVIQIKRGVRLQLTLKYEHRDEVRNVELANVRRALADYIGVSACRSARLFGTEIDLELAISKRGASRLLSHQPALVGAASDVTLDPGAILTAGEAPPASHDRAKARELAPSAPFLVALGVCSPDGKPRPGMAAKLRQIDRFVHTLAGMVGQPPQTGTSLHAAVESRVTPRAAAGLPLSSAPPLSTSGDTASPARLRVCDVGCGRGYLTFAAHSYLSSCGWAVETVGVELRPDLVHEMRGVAQRLGSEFDRLSFQEGDIQDLLSAAQGAAHPWAERPGAAGGVAGDASGDVSGDASGDASGGSGWDVSRDVSGDASGDASGGSGWERSPAPQLDVLVALHACDTATDDALYFGLSRGARVLLTAPCCHKEIRRQMDGALAAGANGGTARAAAAADPGRPAVTPPGHLDARPTAAALASDGGSGLPRQALRPMLRHGIFRERMAEMCTDTVRALLLELAGYEVRVFEFVGGEHTAKNVMLAASKRQVRRTDAELAQIRAELAMQLQLAGATRQRLAERMGELGGGGRSHGTRQPRSLRTMPLPGVPGTARRRRVAVGDEATE